MGVAARKCPGQRPPAGGGNGEAPCSLPGRGESLEKRRKRCGCKVCMANALCVVSVRSNGE